MCVLRAECVQEATKREEKAQQAILRSLAVSPPRVLPFPSLLPSPPSLLPACRCLGRPMRGYMIETAARDMIETRGQVNALSVRGMPSVCLSVCMYVRLLHVVGVGDACVYDRRGECDCLLSAFVECLSLSAVGLCARARARTAARERSATAACATSFCKIRG